MKLIQSLKHMVVNVKKPKQSPRFSSSINRVKLAPPAPQYTTKAFHNLRKHWYKQLKSSGFNDIEYTGPRGQESRYSTDYSLGAIRARYTPEAEEHWRRVSLFTRHYNWRSFKGPINPAIARFIWLKWVELGTFQAVVDSFKLPNAPLKRLRAGKAEAAPSIFWVHTTFKRSIEPVFKAWCVGEGREWLIVDHDLGL